MNKPAIEFKNVSVALDNKVVLQDISFMLEEGCSLALVGPNGAGKTVLLRTALGLIRPSKGEIRIFGLHPSKGRKHIGYVPQIGTFEKNFPITVGKVVQMGCIGTKTPYKKQLEKTEKILNKLKLQNIRQNRIKELSQGQLQRVLIARALISNPRMLFLDEPTANLDLTSDLTLWSILNELKRKMTIVIVSHDLSVVTALIDHIACLNKNLYFHSADELTEKELSKVYEGPFEIFTHLKAKRILKEHSGN